MGCVGCPDCNTCPNCCTTSTPCPGGAWCTSFFAQVCSALGVPSPGRNNVGALLVWSRYEGTRAGWNPLATTEVYGTYSWWNCAPHYVKCYADEASGVGATAATLRLPYYTSILAALQHDLPLCAWGAVAADEVDTWGTSGFATYLRSLTPCTGSPQCPACDACSACTDPTVGCVPLQCPPCTTCRSGNCESLCAAGQACVGGVCVTAPPSPPPSSASVAAGLLVLAGVVAAGVWEARRRPAVVATGEHYLRPGGAPALGAHSASAAVGAPVHSAAWSPPPSRLPRPRSPRPPRSTTATTG